MTTKFWPLMGSATPGSVPQGDAGAQQGPAPEGEQPAEDVDADQRPGQVGQADPVAVLQRSPSTVRRWMRRAMRSAHLHWLWRRGSQVLIRLDPDAFNQLPRPTSPLRDALTVLAAAASAARRPLGLTDPVWTVIGLHAQGRLLAAPT